jgi:hypothetical protein
MGQPNKLRQIEADILKQKWKYQELDFGFQLYSIYPLNFPLLRAMNVVSLHGTAQRFALPAGGRDETTPFYGNQP